MRLYEITRDNRIIIALKQLSEDYEYRFVDLMSNLQMFRKLKGIRLDNFIESRVVPFKKELEEFLNTQFYDDPDIDVIKNRLSEMLAQLS